MKNLFFIFLFGLLITSCSEEFSKESTLNFNTIEEPEDLATPNDLRSEVLLLQDPEKVHVTILNSQWWNSLSDHAQSALAIELNGASETISNDQLMKLKRNNQATWKQKSVVGTRSIGCPGYPAANPTGDVFLGSQSDVDAFGALGCNDILGELVIDDTGSPDKICDLTPLSNLETVGSSMLIAVTCASTLDGLDNLKSIGMIGPLGAFSIIGSPSMTDISALSNLETVTGSINIKVNSSLKNLKGLEGIEEIGPGQTTVPIISSYGVFITNNPNLTNLHGLSSLTTVAGGILLADNDHLANLSGFSGLENVGTFPGAPLPPLSVVIFGNAHLRNLSGLSNLVSIGGYLAIYENEMINNLSGLTSLQEVGAIYIDHNQSLKNVDHLGNIHSTVAELEITNNPELKKCCGLYNLLCSDPPVCSSNGVGAYVLIANNHPDCSVAEIIENGPCGN